MMADTLFYLLSPTVGTMAIIYVFFKSSYKNEFSDLIMLTCYSNLLGKMFKAMEVNRKNSKKIK